MKESRSNMTYIRYLLVVLLLVICIFCLCACTTGGPSNNLTNPTESPTEPSEPTEPTEVTLSPSERFQYFPHCITVNLYDVENNIYTFNWNTDAEPLNAVVQMCAGNTFNESTAVNYTASVEVVEGVIVCKARIALEPGKTYAYRIYDTKAKIGSGEFTISGRNPDTDKFTFVHLSDSQIKETGYAFELHTVLSQIIGKGADPEFLLHTGDVVQYGGWENYWRNMLDLCPDYLSRVPFATIGGNHETKEHGGSLYDIYKHFDAKMPEQDISRGYYYSFDYGDVRFIMLNTNTLNANYKLCKDQYDWLVSQLESNDKKWIIVSMHHAMYAPHEWSSGNSFAYDKTKDGLWVNLRDQLNGLFVEYGVDLVLQGHTHTYSYTYPMAAGDVALKETATDDNYFVNPEGVIYSTHGPTGNQGSLETSPLEASEDLYKFTGKALRASYAEITVDGNKLTVTVKSCVNGTPKTVFTYGIIKDN